MAREDYTRLSKLLKHCTVAVFKNANVIGNTVEERWLGAWNIARARLTQLGFLAPGSETGPAATIRHTHKGAGKSTKHSAEGAAKNRFFNSKIWILQKNEEGAKINVHKPSEDDVLVGPEEQFQKVKDQLKKALSPKAVKKPDPKPPPKNFPKSFKSKATKVKKAKFAKTKKAKKA
jgi:hypothetical protein